MLRQRGATRAALLAELRAAWGGMAASGPEAAGYVVLRRGGAAAPQVVEAALMNDFYRRLDGAATKAETLRQTMSAFCDDRIIPPQDDFDPGDPYYWAPFVLVGDWR